MTSKIFFTNIFNNIVLDSFVDVFSSCFFTTQDPNVRYLVKMDSSLNVRCLAKMDSNLNVIYLVKMDPSPNVRYLDMMDSNPT